MEFCKECACLCKPIDKACVTKYSDIKDPTILDASHYNKATNDIKTLIGFDCAKELCAALKKAAEDAETNGNDILDNLEQAWKDIIENDEFKMWYSNRLLWHWVFGASTSEISASGLVTTRNNDDDYKNSYEHASEDERKRIQNTATFYSNQARKDFIEYFWDCNKHNYDCAELDCGCTLHKKCKEHCRKDSGNRRIGITVV